MTTTQKPKGVKVEGTMKIGSGRETPLFLATAIATCGDTSKVDVILSADDRHVGLRLDRASAVALARRILEELGEELPGRPLIEVLTDVPRR